MGVNRTLELAGIEGKKQLFAVDPTKIIVDKDWNPQRFDFAGQEELEASIKENGVRNPITVKWDEEKQSLILIDGNRRLRACLTLIKKGTPIKTIPAYLERRTISQAEAYITGLIANDSKKFLPAEEAFTFGKLIKWGWTPRQIADKLGKSEGFVRNRLALLEGDKEVLQAVKSKEINVSTAAQLNAVESKEERKELLEKAKAPDVEKKKEVKKKISKNVSFKKADLESQLDDLKEQFDNTKDEFEKIVYESENIDLKSVTHEFSKLSVLCGKIEIISGLLDLKSSFKESLEVIRDDFTKVLFNM